MDYLPVIGGVILATLVIFVYLLFIWWLDRYEREPLWIVGLVFGWGGIGGTCLGCMLSLPMVVIAGALPLELRPEVISSVFVAPVAEELTKGLVFLPLVLTHHFDNETDGLIYGAAAGLGFACVENLLYYVQAIQSGGDAVFHVIVMRTFFTALVHCISSALLGMAIGYARHRSGAARWLIYPAIGYVAAVINHAVWNGTAVYAGLPIFAESTRGLILTAGLGIVVVASIAMFLITQFSLDREHKIIQRFLEKEAERGILPARHAEIIPYWTKRRKSDWLPSAIPRDEYVRIATLLAFRHYQLEISEGERREEYQDDISRFREELRDMLEGVAPG